MPYEIKNPNAVTQAGGANWQNPINALGADASAYAVNAVSGDGGYLVFAFPLGAIPANALITGIRVELTAVGQYSNTAAPVVVDANGNPKPRTLTIEVSKDGATWAPNVQRTLNLPNQLGFTTYTVGGQFDLWGQSWAAGEVNGTNLRVRVRRPIGLSDEDTGGYRTVESVVVTAFYTTMPGTTQADRPAKLTQYLLGRESIPGTRVPATFRVRSWKFEPQPQIETEEVPDYGSILEGDEVLTYEASEVSFDGYPTFDEPIPILESLIGKAVVAQLAAGVYRWEFNLEARSRANVQTLSGEVGDTSIAERVAYMIATEFQLSTKKKEHGMSGKFMAQAIDDSSPISQPNVADVQSLALNGATAVTLRYKGAQTASVATPNAGTLQTALQGLSTVGAGNMTVSGTGPFVLTGAGALAGQTLALVEVVAATGGTPTVTHTTVGGLAQYAGIAMEPGNWAMYYTSNLADLGTTATKFTRLRGCDLTIGNRFQGEAFMDPAQGKGWGVAIEDVMNVGAKFVVQADKNASQLTADLRNRAAKYVRLENVGLPIGATGYSYTCQIDMAAKVRVLGNYSEDGVIRAREFELKARQDSAWGRALRIVLINDVPPY